MGVSDDRPQREAAQVEPGAFAGDGCLKKNDVMGFSAFFALPPPGAGLPRFILARPARSQPLARPTKSPGRRSGVASRFRSRV